MLQQKTPLDFVIGSGKKNSIREFTYEVFKLLKIKKNRLKLNTKKLIRKKDIKSYKANISFIKKKLKWKPQTSFKKIIFKMVNQELF